MIGKRGNENRSRYRGFSKKGQVTVFIIIGIIILFAFAGVLFITKTTAKQTLDASGDPIISEVPLVFQPLQTYTENCIYEIGKRGLLLLGEQGGYIYPELAGEYSGDNPTDADGLLLGDLRVPYWHYNIEPNKGNKIVFHSLRPPLTIEEASNNPEMSVETQLARYLQENIDDCLNGYQPFFEQGFEVDVGEVEETSVGVKETTVNFNLKMKVRARRGDAVNDFEQFYVKIPLQLKRYYDVASNLLGAEENYSFLEKQSLNIVHTFSGVDEDKLPPASGMTFDLAPTVYWIVPDVKEKMQQLLFTYTPMLRFLQSNNLYRYQYPDSRLSESFQKNYDNMILPLLGAEDLNINFDYLNWPLYFKVNSNEDTLFPASITLPLFNLGVFGMQKYNTVYDFSYPVLVTLNDERAFEGEGFNLVFGLESNVRTNQPAEGEKVVPSMIASFSESMVCDKDKYDTEMIKTIVVDSSNEVPLETVQIGLTIPEVDDCVIGQTDNDGVLESTYPAVYGGILTYVKEGYLSSYYPVDTYRYKEGQGIIGYAFTTRGEKVVKLHPFKTLSVSVKKKTLEKCIKECAEDEECPYNCPSSGVFGAQGKEVYQFSPALLDAEHKWVFSDVVRPLEEKEKALIMLKRVSDIHQGVFGEDYSATIGISGEGQQEVQLVPGIYEVMGILSLEEELVIPAEERCTGGIVALFCDKEEGCCFDYGETTLDNFMAGQINWDTERTYLKIKPEDLYHSNSLEFYFPTINLKNVPEEPHKRVLEDLKLMGMMDDLSKELRDDLKPIFKE